MKLTIFKTITVLLLFGCKNETAQNVEGNVSGKTQKACLVELESKGIGESETKKSLQNDLYSETYELLQGKWQSTDDKTNYLVFEGNLRKEIAGDMSEWDKEQFILSNKCQNENGNTNDNDSTSKYISCIESDLCWYIVDLTKNHLLLSYTARGNSLEYVKVK